ncbi:putative 2nd cystathione gamma synthase [Ostreococcus lucimarinus CCE9901]|uniref:cystathionine gamma-lyase n=1 Tax=Ostreococcus lucimarinus (strain CCE9901) TaxID=436017 RepID=A4S3Y0_OSTLU|nr:putative 2nd cystathione gamma synthase [Ostreococcus lucimarinus CCE9901]ABO98464.1 putative 2nd cystathione gamma synthase [Ostreococcus lucimarinus CCE9901]|eukprot:XP_001420171.1 putative 2nd cystathione gamma synthase [Ostreococcus lucimarinus CCE9901]
MLDHGTLLVRGAADAADDPTRSVIQPIYPSTTYARDDAHELPRFRDRTLCYARPDNPSVRACERTLRDLERGSDCALFSSGMAAVNAVLEGAVRGTSDASSFACSPSRGYFAVRARIREWCAARGVEVVEYDPDVPGRKAALVWVESPANPTWDVMDLEQVVAVARACDAGCVCVDSTVLTPICTKPLSFGVDVVMHSATKYLNGHGDVVAGALVTRECDDRWQRILHERKLGGATMGSMDAYLLSRGMRTLELRVRRQSESAMWIAHEFEQYLRSRIPHGAIVLYPGLQTDTTVESKNAHYDIVNRMCPNGVCDYWTCATSLGGFESLIEHRYSVECAPGEKEPHVPGGLLRLSVGLETKEDLLAGLKRGFDIALMDVVGASVAT